MPGRIPLESLAGIAWNPWPESNGITGRDHVESVAGIVWNLHMVTGRGYRTPFSAALEPVWERKPGRPVALFQKTRTLSAAY